MDKKQETTLPFKWSGWDQQDVLVNSYYKAEFVENFGVFKKGELFECIEIDYGKGIIKAYNEEGTELFKEQKFISIPSNEFPWT